jgi:hypothetical protein
MTDFAFSAACFFSETLDFLFAFILKIFLIRKNLVTQPKVVDLEENGGKKTLKVELLPGSE